ncbi:TRAP transporter small permease [Rhodovulum sp. 12E13]|uniref:TRAP transporter small permease n=1 Tax=Rhodovulum sp. 12E13 TaxID=2203891 RepID=UPI000E1210FD|nr:TRAP transporter small permease [Rhodovulum sp. 12E13]RDC73825.1 TRAP transporter small permease [Rhodovulum sp. 12E13]
MHLPRFATHAALRLACLAAFAMMAHVTADVAGRALFGRPLTGTAEIVTAWYMVAVVCLPWACLAQTDGQLRADLVVRLLPAGPRAWVDTAVRLVVLGYLGLMAWQTGLHALRQTARGEVLQAGALYLPVWPSRWLLPVAAGLAALWVFVALAGPALRGARGLAAAGQSPAPRAGAPRR